MEVFTNTHNGIRFTVNKLNAPKDANGRPLYCIDIEGLGSYNERFSNIEFALTGAKETIDDEYPM